MSSDASSSWRIAHDAEIIQTNGGVALLSQTARSHAKSTLQSYAARLAKSAKSARQSKASIWFSLADSPVMPIGVILRCLPFALILGARTRRLQKGVDP